MYDIIVIGAGPAGLTAAIYACRAGKRVLVLEKGAFGGQITFSPRVENIPGFASVTGNEFADALVEQALGQGADVEPAEVLSVTGGEIKTVVTDSGEYTARAVIIAVGARHRLPGIPREDEYIGCGISFCAVCDGAFYEGKRVAVLGGGNSALQEALLLSETSERVFVIQNLDKFTGEGKLVERLLEKENVEVFFSSKITELFGEGELSGVNVRSEITGETERLSVDGLFIAIGLVPQNEPFANVLTLDKWGYAAADESCTVSDGIFVAGDCRAKRIRQVTTAASDGAVAAITACEYLDK